jgi:hypothetical protein
LPCHSVSGRLRFDFQYQLHARRPAVPAGFGRIGNWKWR